jgi:phosphoserine phosphatase RsbU/P
MALGGRGVPAPAVTTDSDRKAMPAAGARSAGPLGADAVEAARMAAVARYDILDTPPDGAFDRIAAIAARVLAVPIASIAIVDTDRIWFKAAHGLAGVTQIGRDPGLCASVIQHGAPLHFADVLADPVAAVNPLVCGEMGIRFYAGAPIITSDGHRLGTLNVLDTQPRHLDESQIGLLTDLAAVVMDQLELRLSGLATLRRERDLRAQAERDKAMIEDYAATLQAALLPPSLPRIPGLELASHYYAASPRDVGGDFYDVFSLGNGRWAFFLGDVEGHGGAAATVTALARHTLHAAALHDPDPVAALTELNTVLTADRHTRRSATALYGVLDPNPGGGFTIVLGSAGHPPALHLRPAPEPAAAAQVDTVWPAGGQLLGVFPEATIATRRLHLKPGDTLLLYTDGLIEARPHGRMVGEDGLITFCRQAHATTAATLVDCLTEVINSFQPAPPDDIALLALHVPSDQ